MNKILLVTSSPRGAASHSTRIATELAESLGGEVTTRDLTKLPMRIVDEEYLAALFTPDAERTEVHRRALEIADQLIDEVLEADTIVIGAAMINFGMPTTLKMWIDLVTRVGKTVVYGEAGPEGLLGDKRAILVLASGGLYQTGAHSAMNHLEPALRTNLAFLGIKEPKVIRIEGTLHGEEAVEQALISARGEIRNLIPA